jgi:uncharacterized protein YbcC (UPF0753/DUF2309 family)
MMINKATDKRMKRGFTSLSKRLGNANVSANIRTMVNNASQFISPVWPIETFIACNPLQGLESLPFEEALAEATRIYGADNKEIEPSLVNREMIKWCGAFLDLGQGTIEMPRRSEGFYNGFRMLSIEDKRLHQGVKKNIDWLGRLPEKAEHAIDLCLEALGVSLENQEDFIKELLSFLPGWAGYVKWRTAWRNPSSSVDKTSVTLVDFVAVRLVITTILWPDARLKKSDRIATPVQKALIKKMERLEKIYSQSLLENILYHHGKKQESPKARPDAQFVFCIDVRSEPFRYCLEKTGHYETFGFAGFFGLPVRIHSYNTGESSDSCPVLLKPRYDIHEVPIIQSFSCVKRHMHTREKINRLKQAYQDLKYNFSTPFSLVETLGAWCGIRMLARTLAPVFSAKWVSWLTKKMMLTVDTQPLVTLNKGDSLSGIAPAEQVLYAEAVLRMMGLTENFARVVLFCGHGSTTQNNPYASALDCGACGGNHGGSNAKVLAAILNRQSVRASLYDRGIIIPADTQFKAAEHNTTTDAVVIYSEENDHENNVHADLMKSMQVDLLTAQRMNSETRCKTFGESHLKDPIHATQKRSHDWSEVRPEWGLARNAAFIIGPRRLTTSIDLQGRCFLHSYEWDQDENGTSLETIMTAPMVVAEWINTQYLFSTLDNVAYGSGSKITHNVTAKIGVMQGNGSDLMHGLPLQSVMMTDEESYHEPQRLLTVIYAPREKIKPIIERQEVLKTLFFNGWVKLIAIEPEQNQAYELDRQGQWHLITFKKSAEIEPIHDTISASMLMERVDAL